MMNSDEIVAYLLKEVAPRYNSLKNKEKRLYHAILQSLPSDTLPEVEKKLRDAVFVPWDLLSFFNWMQVEHQKNVEQPNEPIATLLRWYEDKKSKKVSYAYNRLTKRLDAQSYSDQQKVLAAFLEGGKKSSEWAANWLRKHWIPGLENEIENAWRTYKGSVMARTIIYMMPESFVMQEQDNLIKAASNYSDAYAILCGRLGRTPGFRIDETRLSILDWFYVVGKLVLDEKLPEIDEKVVQFIHSMKCEDFIETEYRPENGLLYQLGMSRIIWAMKRLNYTEGLIHLARIEQDVLSLVYFSDVDGFELASSLYFLKSLIDNCAYDEEDFKNHLQSWRHYRQ